MDVKLDGETRLTFIVGDPIAQVKSPEGLTRILRARGANALVLPAHVTAADFAGFMAGVRRLRNLDAVIATVPHKFALLDYCDTLTDRAAFVGSVNVSRRRADGSWAGDNLDGVGCLEGIAGEGFAVAGKRALLVGAGGAGSAIAFEFLDRGGAALAVHDVDAARRDRLVAKLNQRFAGRAQAGGPDPSGFDLIANATPAGMRDGDPLPVDAARLGAGQFVACAITKPAASPLIVKAREAGCATMPGLGMFRGQAEALVDILMDGR